VKDQLDPARVEYIRKWLVKADNDLLIAKDERYLKNENHVTDGICFHCQQAVEKYLKGFLVYHDVDFGKTHNLEYLRVQCSTIDAEFETLSVGDLSQYGVAVRYPDDFYMPTLEEADEAIVLAEQARIFVLNKMIMMLNS
jgi:HEPN domain-containing protein